LKQVSIREAKSRLSVLVNKAANGESFVIARAGKPLVKVIAIDSPSPGEGRRLGFMANRVKVPDDFDRMGRKEINRLFGTGR
jgi:prevent-host-death family protein